MQVNHIIFPPPHPPHKTIFRHQQLDKELRNLARKHGGYTIKPFHGAGKTRHLICINDKIVIPKTLQRRVVEWYHNHPCHPGTTRTELTIKQHFTWLNLRETVKHLCSKCHIKKRQTKDDFTQPDNLS